MAEDIKMTLLRLDLQRIGEAPDAPLLENYLGAASSNLKRQGITEDESEDYTALVVGTAAWMYRKRVTGEGEPRYLKRMRCDLWGAQKLGGGVDAP